MCLCTSKGYDPSHLTTGEQLKRSNFDFHHLQRKRIMGMKNPRNKTRVLFVMLKRKMAMKNLKLYIQNQCIIEENERLRRKALLLHQENQVLLCQLQNVKINPQNINTDVIV
ncbi:hypothetical protein L2E82_14535 [Cichorium intybus]|uniref:Uncharacterized protein n=1 Tax=Cichorium intybus TaxID=13427 RepID=A0ACB9F097_CICIN|nr:hypothetical protein L1887_34135 [Cichorium endivia]KAI3764524.1 hypothetical protein L2E82_14535 [Cichorium intybus]